MNLTLSPDLFHISATSSLMTLLPLHIVNSMLLASSISFRLPFHYSCLNASSLFFSSTPIRVDVHGHEKKNGQKYFSPEKPRTRQRILMKAVLGFRGVSGAGNMAGLSNTGSVLEKQWFQIRDRQGRPRSWPRIVLRYLQFTCIGWQLVDCTMSFFKVQGLGRQKLYLYFRKNWVQCITYQEQLYS